MLDGLGVALGVSGVARMTKERRLVGLLLSLGEFFVRLRFIPDTLLPQHFLPSNCGDDYLVYT